MSNQFKILKNAKKFSKSSQKWLRRQINDPFVFKAKTEGWRSRSAFKIIEIDKKFKIFKKDHIVVDLGASPGGWSQFAVKIVGEGTHLPSSFGVIALLRMTALSMRFPKIAKSAGSATSEPKTAIVTTVTPA